METIVFKLHAETELPLDVIESIPQSGPADGAIAELRSFYNFECEPKDAITYLKSTGGWLAEDLQDHETNLDRLVWLACLDCRENETTYFYMGD